MIRHNHRPRPTPALWQRALALAGVMLVLVLNLLAAAPHLHAKLHAETPVHGHGDCAHADDTVPEKGDDTGCVITQFANGKVGCEFAVVVVTMPLVPQPAFAHLFVEALPSEPAFGLPPGCGPPAV